MHIYCETDGYRLAKSAEVNKPNWRRQKNLARPQILSNSLLNYCYSVLNYRNRISHNYDKCKAEWLKFLFLKSTFVFRLVVKFLVFSIDCSCYYLIRYFFYLGNSFACTREDLENTINQQRRQIEELLDDKGQLHLSLVESRERTAYLEKEVIK